MEKQFSLHSELNCSKSEAREIRMNIKATTIKFKMNEMVFIKLSLQNSGNSCKFK